MHPEPPRNVDSSIGVRQEQYCALRTEDPYDRRDAPVPDEFSSDHRELRSIGTMTPEDVSSCLGAAKAINILGGMESAGSCSVEKTSVYGAAVAMPQIARSARWPKSLIALTMRAYLFVLLNYIVQTFFVYYIYDSQTNMNPFGGQMHLCDFGAHINSCPHGADCLGPAGTRMENPGVLYPYDIWNTRKFTRDTLQQLFPDLKDKIGDAVDPGEYGLESYYCRFLCIFVFMVAIADEFQNIRDLVGLLYYIPALESTWVQYDKPDSAPKACGEDDLKYVRFFVNGMPLRWKVFNCLFLLIPKIFIWRMLTMAGVHFLMETAAMVDQIVNTTALSFVFTTDELILERLTTKATKYIMSNLEDYELFDSTTFDNESDEQTLDRYNREEMTCHWSIADWWLFPRRLFWSIALMAIFLSEYYWHNCEKSRDGGWVSVDMYLPPEAHLEIGSFVKKFFSLPHNTIGGAFWTMPEYVANE